MTSDRICCLEEREDLRDRLDFVRGQINRLSTSIKERIRTLSDDVTAKVNAPAEGVASGVVSGVTHTFSQKKNVTSGTCREKSTDERNDLDGVFSSSVIGSY